MTNLITTLEELGVDFRQHGDSPHVSPDWIGVICPWCGKGTGKYGLGINLSSHACTCWRCGRHSLIEALHEITGQDFDYLRSKLPEASESTFTRRTRPRGILCEPDGICDLMPYHLEYLQGRGFSREDITNLIKIWEIRGIGLSRRISGAVYLPVHQGGEVVSWVARSIRIGHGNNRYTNARDDESVVPIKECLFGLDYARHAAIVVEGPFDAMRVGPGAVATFGSAFTDVQVAKLSKFPVRAVCLDRDAGSQSHRLCRKLAALPGSTCGVTLSSKDPGSAPREEIDELRREFLE